MRKKMGMKRGRDDVRDFTTRAYFYITLRIRIPF